MGGSDGASAEDAAADEDDVEALLCLGGGVGVFFLRLSFLELSPAAPPIGVGGNFEFLAS